jgi:hypothetical protein
MKEYKEKSFSEIKVGDSEWLRRTVTEANIVNFAGVSRDFNVLHTDEIDHSSNNEINFSPFTLLQCPERKQGNAN